MIQNDMLWRDMICNRKQCVYTINKNKKYRIWKYHVFVHASKALYQLYNLCVSHQSHHETIHYSRPILLQLTLLANICVNIAVRTISHNQTCGVLKTWLARNKLQKLRTHHANWHRIVFFLQRFCSVVLRLYIVALFQPRSLWCFFSCGVVTNNMRAESYPRLEKHADDGHHRKSSISDFGIKLFRLFSRVRRGQHLESKVSSIRSTSWGLFLGDLAESHVGQDLTPSCRVGILDLLKTT